MLAKKRGLGYAALCLMILLMIGLYVYVKEEENNAVLDNLKVLSAGVEIKESPDIYSATITTRGAGTAVIVESRDGKWAKVLLLQGVEGYIPESAVDFIELDIAKEEQILKQRRTSLIWGIVTAILTIGISGVGVVATIKNSREAENAEEEAEEPEAEAKRTAENKEMDIDIEEITDEEEEEEQ